MSYEAELKFSCSDPSDIERRLARWQIAWSEPIEQVDAYFAHPSRDFAETDEALRIRSTPSGRRITYKGPKLDSQTKTRREIELPLPADETTGVAGGAAPQCDFESLLEALGFRPVAVVRKRRRFGGFIRCGRPFEAALDDVEHVGRYVEIETTVLDRRDLDAARRDLLAVAAELGLADSEPRSYLELLLERKQP